MRHKKTPTCRRGKRIAKKSLPYRRRWSNMLAAEVILHCPRCGEVMIHEKKQGFWKCPRCGGEFWDDESKLAMLEQKEAEKVVAVELRKQLLWSLGKGYTEVLPPVAVWVPGKGSRKSGRKRKKPVKRFLPGYLT
jgi:ribosomal protein L37AE/L43A